MANEEAKLFVAGLPDSISEEVLKQLFEATGGKVVGVSLPKDRMTGRPRGFGFVTLATPQEAQAARDALDGSMQAGKSISVRPFQAEPPRATARRGPPTAIARRGPPGPRGPEVRSRPPTGRSTSATSPTTRRSKRCRPSSTAAAPDGVVRVHLPMDADGRKRGFGFVTMASSEAAKTAADALRHGRPPRPPAGRQPGPPQGRAPRRPAAAAVAAASAAPFPPSFGGGRPAGGPSTKPAAYEERRKRTFEDGGGARNTGSAASAKSAAAPTRHRLRQRRRRQSATVPAKPRAGAIAVASRLSSRLPGPRHRRSTERRTTRPRLLAWPDALLLLPPVWAGPGLTKPAR